MAFRKIIDAKKLSNPKSIYKETQPHSTGAQKVKSQTYLGVVLVTLAAIWVSTLPSQAQIIWGTAQNVSNDSNVLTDGTYFDAALLLAGANGGSPLTVNSVVFNLIASGTTNVTDPSGDIELTSQRNAAAGVDSPDPTATAAYNTLLTSPVYSIGAVQTLTLNHLTVGDTYQVEVWSATGRTGSFLTDFSGSTPVTLNSNTEQYAVGTFVANATTFSFTANAGTGSQANASIFNAASVFDEGVLSVPEPSTYVLLFAGFLALAVIQSRRQKSQAH